MFFLLFTQPWQNNTLLKTRILLSFFSYFTSSSSSSRSLLQSKYIFNYCLDHLDTMIHILTARTLYLSFFYLSLLYLIFLFNITAVTVSYLLIIDINVTIGYTFDDEHSLCIFIHFFIISSFRSLIIYSYLFVLLFISSWQKNR